SFVLLQHRPKINGNLVIQAGDEPLPASRYDVVGNTVTFLDALGRPGLRTGPIKATYDYDEIGYDGLLVKDTGVDIYDGDAPAVIIQQARGSTDVIEGDSVGDAYEIRLSKKLAPGTTVTVKIDSIDTRTTVGINTYFQKQVNVAGGLSTTVTFNEF